jgi:hypothetical protein
MVNVCVIFKLFQRSLCRVPARRKGRIKLGNNHKPSTTNHQSRSTLCKERIFYQCFAGFVKCVANIGVVLISAALCYGACSGQKAASKKGETTQKQFPLLYIESEYS